MKRVNLENQIRKEMQKREIRPSENAWEKLENRLDAAESKKNFPMWIYAVAAVLLVVFISSIFIKEDISDSRQIVNENQNSAIPGQTIPQEVVVESDSKTEEKIESGNYKKGIVANEKSALEEVEIKPSAPEVSEEMMIVSEQELIEKSTPEEVEDSEEFLNQKAVDVAGSIRDLYETNENVDIDEVEALLEQARKEIFTERILKNSKTDAMALLDEVEWELDKTFYDKVFYALGENFKKLANAYADRNK